MNIITKIAKTAGATFVAAGGALAAGIITGVGIGLLTRTWAKFSNDIDTIWPTPKNTEGGN